MLLSSVLLCMTHATENALAFSGILTVNKVYSSGNLPSHLLRIAAVFKIKISIFPYRLLVMSKKFVPSASTLL